MTTEVSSRPRAGLGSATRLWILAGHVIQVVPELRVVDRGCSPEEFNRGLGRDDLSEADLELAARSVEAHRYIDRLPEGYATELRERGTNLSAGQRQLLSFARAVAHGAHILILDEATSSIDTETEAAIQRGIHALMEGKTAIAIAHRLSTIQDVDRIYVLHKGRVVEQGHHQELLAAQGVYHRLYQLQYSQEEGSGAAVAG